MSVYSVAEVYHQILYIRQKENGRTSIPWCLCVFAQLVDGVVQCCSNSVMHLCLWMVMHSLDIHAWLAVTGKTDTFSKFTILCQSLEDKPFFIMSGFDNLLEVTMILGMIWLLLSPVREVRGDKLAWLTSCTSSFE